MGPPSPLEISVIVPVRNGAATLPACLGALRASTHAPHEVIVVDDGSADDSAAIARAFGATVISLSGRHGPAYARNRGAEAARGAILFFVDADVRVHADSVARVHASFAADPGLDAVFGSYDADPPAPGLVSRYKNLQHHFVHQRGAERASTFWCGCGAVRRERFLALGGLDEAYRRPSIEDIEFGQRLAAAGGRIRLDRDLQGAHLKRWTFRSLLVADIRDRAIPWSRLILRSRTLPGTLNLSAGGRASVALAWAAVAFSAAGFAVPLLGAFAVPALGGVVALNWPFYRLLGRKGGWRLACGGVPLHLLYFLYSGAAFAGVALAHLLGLRTAAGRPGTPGAHGPGS